MHSIQVNNSYNKTENELNISEVNSNFKIKNTYIEQKGIPIIPVMGEFHFSRYPHSEWEDAIAKMKAGGITIISTYLFWNYHEEIEGTFDFHGDKNIHQFLKLCENYGMLVLARIGPWCHGEVLYGGFPEFIQQRNDKRTNAPEYMKKVQKIYEAYYTQMKDFFYQDGSILIGIQLENEYGGQDPDYINALRQMAVDIGFKLPLYTITAWPPNGNLKGNLLPMFGRYPERPWTSHTQPLPNDNRFHIMKERIDKTIGTDVLKGIKWENLPYENYPYATCELGCGIQVTEHRRPIISPMDAYSLLIIQLAQGVNMPGYYMFHGGRNQPGGEYQESIKSGYCNNYPVSSYDFQAPISEYGYIRESYHFLKLVHYFLQSKGAQLAPLPCVFSNNPDWKYHHRIAVRSDQNGHGYVFVNNYQRLHPFEDITEISLHIQTTHGTIDIESLTFPSGVSMFFPTHFDIANQHFDYFVAQPICTQIDGHIQRHYYFIPDGVCSTYKYTSLHEGNRKTMYGTVEHNDLDKPVFVFPDEKGQAEIYLLSEKKARCLWLIDNKVLFSKEPTLKIKECVYSDCIVNIDDFTNTENPSGITLNPSVNTEKAFDEYLFSSEEKKTYRLKIQKNLLDTYDDIKIEFSLKGNVAQMYCNGNLVADWYNINDTWTIGLKRFKSLIQDDNEFEIQVSPLDPHKDIYFEHNVQRGVAKLSLSKATFIQRQRNI